MIAKKHFVIAGFGVYVDVVDIATESQYRLDMFLQFFLELRVQAVFVEKISNGVEHEKFLFLTAPARVNFLLDGLIERLDANGGKAKLCERADFRIVVVRLMRIRDENEVCPRILGDVGVERFAYLAVEVINFLSAIVRNGVRLVNGRERNARRDCLRNGRAT